MAKTRRFFLPFSLAIALLAGCSTTPPPAVAPATAISPPEAAPAPLPGPVRFARVRGSEESSMLLDNFTAYVAAVDGRPVAAGRKGWTTPLGIPAGRRALIVEFVRGVFTARAKLTLDAAPDANYELRFTTDAQLFGNNSFCDFWIVDLGTGEKVTAVTKSPVTKGG